MKPLSRRLDDDSTPGSELLLSKVGLGRVLLVRRLDRVRRGRSTRNGKTEQGSQVHLYLERTLVTGGIVEGHMQRLRCL